MTDEHDEVLRLSESEQVEPLWDYLHNKLSVCGHCGKRSCPDRSYSKLPEQIPVSVLIEAVACLARQPDPEVVRDAERYRWLRNGDIRDCKFPYPIARLADADPMVREKALWEEELDVAIDSLLAAQTPKEEPK